MKTSNHHTFSQDGSVVIDSNPTAQLNDREKVEAAFAELRDQGIFALLYEEGCICGSCTGPKIMEAGCAFYGIDKKEWSSRLAAGTLKYVLLINDKDEVVQCDCDDNGNSTYVRVDQTSVFDDQKVDRTERWLLEGDQSLRDSADLKHRGDVFGEALDTLSKYGFELTWDGNESDAFVLSAGGGSNE